MTNNTVIEFSKVGKKFRKGQRLYLKQALLDIFKPQKKEDFWAVKDISFKIKKGEVVGIIGANGSGKSTILKLIAGVLTPTRGTVKVTGKIGPLIELGAGFHPELTGRENVYLNGTILGLTKKEIDEKFTSIVEFAELQEFIDTPVKHYSSGMYMRLGFSIAIHVNPDILLVDEILAVGDISFQGKCLDIIQKFKDRGVTIIFVSHNIEVMKNICDRAFLIEKGRLTSKGNPFKVASDYLEVSLKKSGKKIEKNNMEMGIIGDNKAKILELWMEDDKGVKKNVFGEETIKINLRVKFFTYSENPIFGVILRAITGVSVLESNSSLLGLKTGRFQDGEERVIRWEFKNYLDLGKYSITPAISYNDGIRFYDWKDDFFWFSVKKPYKTGGVMNFKHSIKIL